MPRGKAENPMRGKGAGKKMVGKNIVGKNIVGKNIVGKKVAGKKVAGNKVVGNKVAGNKVVGKKMADRMGVRTATAGSRGGKLEEGSGPPRRMITGGGRAGQKSRRPRKSDI